MPDLRGEFVRGWDHGRGATDAGRGFGTGRGDAFQHFEGSIVANAEFTGGKATGVFRREKAESVAEGWRGAYAQRDKFILDPSRKARTANETRPRNVAMMYIIRILP